jgi:outer membrane protein assembly factor BamB
MPNWGSNLIALIYGNLSEGKRAGMMESDTNNRICIFGKGGELVSDIKIDLQKNFPAEIDQIVLLSPDVLYVGGKESKAIVFVKKDLSFTPKIDNMYQWKSFEYSGKDLNGGCSNLNRKISIAPIFNPKLLWAKTIKKYNSNGSPIITKDAIVFVVSDRSDRVYPEQYATVIALDKLTGQEKWRYKTSEVVYSYDYFKNIFVLRGQKKLLLLDLLNGNLISEKNDILDGVPSLALRGELIIVGLYNHDRKEYTVDIFNSDKSQKIKSFNLLKMFSSDKEAKYRKIDNLYHGCFEILPNPIFYIVIEEGNAGQVKRKLVIISIGNDGDITWSYEKQLQNKYWESIPIKPLFVQVGNCNIHVVDGESVVILDPVEGKIIYEGSMKISPDMARVAQSGFAWGAYELKSAYASGKVYIDYKDKRIAQVRELACCKSYLDNYAYVDEFYPFQCVCLSKSCKENINQGEYYLEKIWWYAPTERGFERGPKIIYADNHFMIVKEDKRFFNDEVRFWAIGEEALYDSLKRQGSCNGQQTILDS